MNRHEQVMWQGRPIVHPDHGHDLESHAAELEFGGGLTREQANEMAYSEYKTGQHLAAAAHHYRGLLAAQATGDEDEAKKHWTLFSVHSKLAGHDPMSPIAEEIKSHAENTKKMYKFRTHPSDTLLFDRTGKGDVVRK